MPNFSFKKIFFILCFIVAQEASINVMSQLHAGEQAREIECSACLEDVDSESFLSFSCKHAICASCMGRHVDAYKRDRGDGLYCPEKSCRKPVSADDIKPLRDWNFWLDRNYVADLMRILREQQAEVFNKASLANIDAESQRIINQTTRACPSCKTRIEKNNGCNHMHCKKCSYHFCWQCMKPWINHRDFYRCPNAPYIPDNAYNFNQFIPINRDHLPDELPRNYWLRDEPILVARNANHQAVNPLVAGIAGVGGAAIALGGGIAYNASRTIRKPLAQITNVESNQALPTSWLAQKLNMSRQKVAEFGGNLKNKLASKKTNWAATAITTGVALETFAILKAANVDLSAQVNTYLADNHRMYVDLKHPINIVISLAAGLLVRPIFRLTARQSTLDMLISEDAFIKVMKARTVQEISVSQEELLRYCKQIASVNPYDITRLEMRKKVDISISSIDDIDAVLRMCLIYCKALELRREIVIGDVGEQITALESMLHELPDRPLKNSVDTFLRETRYRIAH